MRLPILFLGAFLRLATAQQNPIENFCRRHQHQTAVIDNKLYIDGGKVYYGAAVDNSSVARQNYHLLWENVLETDENTAFPKQHTDLKKDAKVPSVSGGFLWADGVNKMFYLYGGEYDKISDVKPFTKLWYFDILDNSWNQTLPIQSDISWPAFGTGAIDYAKGTGYYYGGCLNNKTTPGWGDAEPLMLSSLVSFDMNTQAWYNKSTDGIPRAEGSLHYIPVSQGGTLVYIGGVQTTSSGKVEFANMSDIHMYDINDGIWYQQIATGDVPQPRKGACAGVTWANDRSSYNFYMFGGLGADGRGVAEVYILTLPSFQWTLIWPTKAEIPHYTNGRGWSTCNVVREFSQMLIMGGLFNDDESTCFEPEIGSQCGLLLGQETAEVNPQKQGAQWWWALRNDINGYRLPENIVSLIGGNENGSATKTAPAQGWATPAAAQYFLRQNYDPPRKPTRSIPVTSATSSSTTASHPSTSDSNVGAIAGGTVGGIIALGALLAIVFFCLRSRLHKLSHSQQNPVHDPKISELGGPDKGHKAASTCALANGTDGPFLGSPTPAYSSQVSQPPPVSWNGDLDHSGHPPASTAEWTHQSGLPSSQAYYSPPSELPEGIQQIHRDQMSAELPDLCIPVGAELPAVRSPVCAELPDLRSPAPIPAPQ